MLALRELNQLLGWKSSSKTSFESLVHIFCRRGRFLDKYKSSYLDIGDVVLVPVMGPFSSLLQKIVNENVLVTLS